MKIVEAQPKTKKRFTAIFRKHKGGPVIKVTNFGQIGGKTFIDEGNLKKRAAFRARHKRDLDTKDFKRAGYLSYFLLWGDNKTLKKNIEDYKNKFKLD
tara:strand:+ start:116 stop:409 length:294 start_codon:yes stop_codon:yes gene_type:complete